MTELISRSKQQNVWKSLATVKPKEIVKFEIVEDEREWNSKVKEGLRQLSLFDTRAEKGSRELDVVRKLPYKYYYHF